MCGQTSGWLASLFEVLVVEVESEPLGVVVLDDLGEEVDVAGQLADVVRVWLDEVLLQEVRDLEIQDTDIKYVQETCKLHKYVCNDPMTEVLNGWMTVMFSRTF